MLQSPLLAVTVIVLEARARSSARARPIFRILDFSKRTTGLARRFCPRHQICKLQGRTQIVQLQVGRRVQPSPPLRPDRRGQVSTQRCAFRQSSSRKNWPFVVCMYACMHASRYHCIRTVTGATQCYRPCCAAHTWYLEPFRACVLLASPLQSSVHMYAAATPYRLSVVSRDQNSSSLVTYILAYPPPHLD